MDLTLRRRKTQRGEPTPRDWFMTSSIAGVIVPDNSDSGSRRSGLDLHTSDSEPLAGVPLKTP
jgi:hypothetical protein